MGRISRIRAAQQLTSGRRVGVSQITWSPILIDPSADKHFQREHGKSICDGAIHRGEAALGVCRHRDARGDGRTDGADRRLRGETSAPLRQPVRRGRGASRSWRSCRSRASRSLSTTPTAGSGARRCRLIKGRETPAGVFAVIEKDDDHHSSLITMPGCRTCSASPGTASRCTAGRCPGLARLRADALRLCGEVVRQDADWYAVMARPGQRQLKFSSAKHDCAPGQIRRSTSGIGFVPSAITVAGPYIGSAIAGPAANATAWTTPAGTASDRFLVIIELDGCAVALAWRVECQLL